MSTELHFFYAVDHVGRLSRPAEGFHSTEEIGIQKVVRKSILTQSLLALD